MESGSSSNPTLRPAFNINIDKDMMSEFFQGKKTLVTGAGGLIGSAFAEKLLIMGAKVRTVKHERPVPFGGSMEIVEGDLRDARTCRRACEGVFAVIHAAGVSGGSKRAATNPLPMFTDSLLMNTQIIEAAREARVQRFLFISNSSVYPKFDGQLGEDMAGKGEPENETGMVKLAGETQCALYSRFTDMRIAVIRAGNAYGQYDNFDLNSSHVLPALIRKAVEGQNPLELWGDGKAVRDFIHTEDIARGGLFILERCADAQPVNIASGRTITIKELAELILKLAGREGTEIKLNPAAPPASPAKIIDTGRMRKLGFQPEISLEEGLSRTIAWYRRNRGDQS